jgi:hypothetical protein
MAEEAQVKPEEDEEEDQDDSDEERDHNFAIEKLFKKEGYPPFSDPDQAETPWFPSSLMGNWSTS